MNEFIKIRNVIKMQIYKIIFKELGKNNGKGHPRTGHEGPEEE
jgi:hypothetical protein